MLRRKVSCSSRLVTHFTSYLVFSDAFLILISLRILSLIVSGLRHLELKPNEEINKQKYGFQQQLKLKKSFLDYLYYFLLLPYAPNKQPTTAAASNPPATALTNLSISPPPAPAANPTPEIPACLSESIYKR